jgi:hypothetical protein
LGRLEIVEEDKTALQEVLTEILSLGVGHVPEPWLRHVNQRMSEDLRIAQIEHVASVGVHARRGHVADDEGEVTIGAGIVVVPAGVRVVAKTGERPSIVVLHVG